ncbi:hypothetical protein TcCL_ESM04670 [Trypanosoma cruzi]|nr:hypothetical protein TcCL_ESM04670 [Trypanosoma cruzi]
METNVETQRQESGSPKELAGIRAQKAPEAAAEFDYRELGEAEAGLASEHKEEVPEEVNAPEAAAEFDYRELGEAEAGLASEHKEEVPEEVAEAAAEFDYRELGEAEAGLASEHKEEVPEEVLRRLPPSLTTGSSVKPKPALPVNTRKKCPRR